MENVVVNVGGKPLIEIAPVVKLHAAFRRHLLEKLDDRIF